MSQYIHRQLWPTPILLGTIDKQLAKELFNYILNKYHNPDEVTEVFNLFKLDEPLLKTLYNDNLIPAIKEYLREYIEQRKKVRHTNYRLKK